jgi:DNA-binding HxlR family transcriptional regulator
VLSQSKQGSLAHCTRNVYGAFVAMKADFTACWGCAVCISLEQFGDRWSQGIIRDMTVRGYPAFRQFQKAGKRKSTNILAGRLRKLESPNILNAEPAAENGRKIYCRLTNKGIALAPVVLQLLLWAARHEQTAAPCGLSKKMAYQREVMLAQTYRRWEQRDTTPLITPLPSPKQSPRRRRSP